MSVSIIVKYQSYMYERDEINKSARIASEMAQKLAIKGPFASNNPSHFRTNAMYIRPETEQATPSPTYAPTHPSSIVTSVTSGGG